MNQKERLTNHLNTYGKINPLEAWVSLGIYRLSAVIHELRKSGKKIKTEFTEVRNQFGEKIDVATYILVKENDNEPTTIL